MDKRLEPPSPHTPLREYSPNILHGPLLTPFGLYLNVVAILFKIEACPPHPMQRSCGHNGLSLGGNMQASEATFRKMAGKIL